MVTRLYVVKVEKSILLVEKYKMELTELYIKEGYIYNELFWKKLIINIYLLEILIKRSFYDIKYIE